MRTLLLAGVLGALSVGAVLPTPSALATPVPGVVQDSFSAGWKAGWDEGWKYVKGQFSIPPIAPIAPIPQPGRDSYTDGYNRGFVAGATRAQRQSY